MSSLRRALYVLFARLLAGPPDAQLYDRLRRGGLADLAAAQGVDLTSDLLDAEDPEASACELQAEYARLLDRVSLRASDYGSGSEDPVLALTAYLREHRLAVDQGVDLPCDHLSIALGIMGELSEAEETGRDADAGLRARSFFLRHLQPWSQAALSEVASASDRRFYRGVAAMLSAFLESERRLYVAA